MTTIVQSQLGTSCFSILYTDHSVWMNHIYGYRVIVFWWHTNPKQNTVTFILFMYLVHVTQCDGPIKQRVNLFLQTNTQIVGVCGQWSVKAIVFTNHCGRVWHQSHREVFLEHCAKCCKTFWELCKMFNQFSGSQRNVLTTLEYPGNFQHIANPLHLPRLPWD